MKRYRNLFALLFFGWMAIIIILSSTSSHYWEKWREYSLLFHFFEYFLLLSLFFLWQFNSRKMSWKKIVIAFMLAAMLAGVDEYHQILVPGRYVEWRDWFCDVAGLVVATIGASIVYFFKWKGRTNV